MSIKVNEARFPLSSGYYRLDRDEHGDYVLSRVNWCEDPMIEQVEIEGVQVERIWTCRAFSLARTVDGVFERRCWEVYARTWPTAAETYVARMLRDGVERMSIRRER